MSSYLSTAAGKKRLAGILLAAALLAVFFAFNRFPKLDAVGADIDAVTASEIQCFQGFCVERDPGESFVESWVNFSLTYLRLVTLGMTFAFLMAGVAEAFLFPPGTQQPSFPRGGGLRRTLRGAMLGPLMNLCSACIVPVSASFQRRGGGLDGAIALVQSSATMNLPALSMVFFVFTPMLGFSRLVLALLGAIIIGPLVLAAVRRTGAAAPEIDDVVSVPVIEIGEERGWRAVLREGFRDWAKASLGYVARLGPLMIVAGFASGLVIQLLSPTTVATYLGNDLTGVVLAATFGILINVPLLFEIPLVAVLILLGMGTAPAAALLFTAAAGGPVTFFGLAGYMPRRAIATFATATWCLGAAGGLAVLGIGSFIWEDADDRPLRVAHGVSAAEEVRRLGREPPVFREAAAAAGVDFRHKRDGSFFNLGGGGAAADFNNDGRLDIFVSNSAGPNALYRGNGDGTFRDVAVAAGVDDPRSAGHGVAWGDYDNDGFLDLYVASWGSSRLFRNNGNETFSDVTQRAGVADPGPDYRTTGAVWGDYDGDGFLDLLVVRHVYSPIEQFTLSDSQRNLLNRCRTPEFLAKPRVPRGVVVHEPNAVASRPDLRRDFSADARPLQLFRNRGDGSFADATALLSDGNGYPSNVMGAGFKPAFLDYDGDGDLDVYVVNDFGIENYANVLWRNDGPAADGGWRFTDVSAATGANVAMFGMGLAAGDYDNDGDLDLYVSDMGASRFLENRGGAYFDVTERTGTGRGEIPENGEVRVSVGWGSGFADFDNDGLLDLYLATGYLDSDPCINHPNQPNALFVNRGDGSFADVSKSSRANDAGTGREVIFADFNNDGRTDLYVVNLGNLDGTTGVSRLYLNETKAKWAWLQVSPLRGDTGRLAIGTKVVVKADGVTRVQYVGLAQGHMSQSVTAVHFGLGAATRVELVEVHWPGGGVQRLSDVEPNQVVTVVQE